MAPERSSVRIVLVRPETAGNVGAAARVMRNFGFGDLVLVAPRLDRPEEMYRWAKGAEAIVEGADLPATLEEALHGCAHAWATTRRRGRLRGRTVTAHEAARETVRRDRAGERVAWVFGPESRGLRTDEVALCSGRVTIPTSPDQPSLNLAQAVAVCAYECAQARTETGESPAAARLAALETREALYRHLETALLGIGFLHEKTARARMATLRSILERAGLSPRDAAFLRGIARQMDWAAGRAATAPAGKKKHP